MRLHELDLAIGHKVALKIIGQDYRAHTFDAQMLGYQKGESVVLVPLAKPGQVLLRRGLEVTVEGTLPDSRFSFESVIDQVADSPFLHIHLEYPPGIRYQPVRRYPRVPVDTPVTVSAHTGLGMTTRAIGGYMLDVSYGGARLVLEKELTAMVTKITIDVMLASPEMEREVTLAAQVRNRSTPVTDYPRCQFAYGVAFMALGDTEALFLRGFCLQEQLRHRVLPLTD